LWLRGVASHATVRVPGEERSGFTNPLVVAQLAIRERTHSLFAVGGQWEIPIDTPVAADHHEFLAYSLLDWLPRGPGLELAGGFRFSVSGSNDDHGTGPAAAPGAARRLSFHANHYHGSNFAAFVNPHAEREIMWRVGTARPLGWKLLPLTATVDGQHPVRGSTEGLHFVTGEVGAQVPIVRGYTLVPSVSGPLSSDRRYDWFLALEIRRR
jgi:hypothetical protein